MAEASNELKVNSLLRHCQISTLPVHFALIRNQRRPSAPALIYCNVRSQPTPQDICFVDRMSFRLPPSTVSPTPTSAERYTHAHYPTHHSLLDASVCLRASALRRVLGSLHVPVFIAQSHVLPDPGHVQRLGIQRCSSHPNRDTQLTHTAFASPHVLVYLSVSFSIYNLLGPGVPFSGTRTTKSLIKFIRKHGDPKYVVFLAKTADTANDRISDVGVAVFRPHSLLL